MKIDFKSLIVSLIFIGVIGFSLLIYSVFIEPSWIRIKKDVFQVSDLGKNEELKVAFLTDFHTGSPMNGIKKLRKIVRISNNLKPDIILLGGDFVIDGVLFGRYIPIEEIAKELSLLEAPMGVWSVIGNHDIYNNPTHIKNVLEASGINLLENQVKVFDDFQIAGVSYDHNSKYRVGIEETFKQAKSDLFTIVLSHSPDLFPEIPYGFAVTGHTHGGQVNLPIVGRSIVPSKYGEKYAYGYIKDDNKEMLVSSGLGNSLLPIRFRVRPEINFIVFKGK